MANSNNKGNQGLKNDQGLALFPGNYRPIILFVNDTNTRIWTDYLFEVNNIIQTDVTEIAINSRLQSALHLPIAGLMDGNGYFSRANNAFTRDEKISAVASLLASYGGTEYTKEQKLDYLLNDGRLSIEIENQELIPKIEDGIFNPQGNFGLQCMSSYDPRDVKEFDPTGRTDKLELTKKVEIPYLDGVITSLEIITSQKIGNTRDILSIGFHATRGEWQEMNMDAKVRFFFPDIDETGTEITPDVHNTRNEFILAGHDEYNRDAPLTNRIARFYKTIETLFPDIVHLDDCLSSITSPDQKRAEAYIMDAMVFAKQGYAVEMAKAINTAQEKSRIPVASILLAKTMKHYVHHVSETENDNFDPIAEPFEEDTVTEDTKNYNPINKNINRIINYFVIPIAAVCVIAGIAGVVLETCSKQKDIKQLKGHVFPYAQESQVEMDSTTQNLTSGIEINKSEFSNLVRKTGLTGVYALISGQDLNQIGHEAYLPGGPIDNLAKMAGVDLYNESNEPTGFVKNGINDLMTQAQTETLYQHLSETN